MPAVFGAIRMDGAGPLACIGAGLSTCKLHCGCLSHDTPLFDVKPIPCNLKRLGGFLPGKLDTRMQSSTCAEGSIRLMQIARAALADTFFKRGFGGEEPEAAASHSASTSSWPEFLRCFFSSACV